MTAARLLNLLVAVGIACAIGWLWRSTDTPLTAAVLYGLGFLWTVAAPGWVLHRLVAGKPRDAFTDLAMGAAIGLVLSTFVWLSLVALGWQNAYVFWPLVPLIGAAAARRRVFDFQPFERHAHPLTMAGFAFVTVASLTPLSRLVFAGSTLPPSHNGWYHDSYWHMGLVWELGRAMPPQDPQVAGGSFWYHWFANAHVAAQAHAAGVEPILAFVRLWQPFIYLVVIALVFVAARELTGRLWPGAIAGLLMAGGTGAQFAQFGLFGMGAFNVLSPSHQYVLVPILLCLIGAIQVMRTDRRWAPLATFTVGVLGCMGGKGSALPVIVCGVGLALVVAWFLDRARVRWLAVLTAIAAVAFAVSMVLTATANAGTHVQLFSTVRATTPWRLLLGGAPPISLEPVIPGLASDGALTLLVLVLLSYLVMYGATWVGLPLLRRGLSAWYLLGVGFAGFAAMQLVNQDGLSQVYFMSGALPAWLLLAAAGTKAAWDHARSAISLRAALPVAGLFGALGWAIALLSRRVGGPLSDPSSINTTIVTSMAVFLVGVGVVVGACLLIDRRVAWLALAGTLVGAQVPWPLIVGAESSPDHQLLVASALGLTCAAGLAAVRTGTGRILLPAAVVVVLAATVAAVIEVHRQTLVEKEAELATSFVSTPETQAALWAQDNLPEHSLIATNVHCSTAPTRDLCDARGFWVAGLTGHRVLIGGWAYTPAAHEAHGVGGRIFSQQPFEDPELFALNEAAFAEPTDAVLEELRSRGVTALFASLRHNDVSEDLSALADEVYRNNDAVIYSIVE